MMMRFTQAIFRGILLLLGFAIGLFLCYTLIPKSWQQNLSFKPGTAGFTGKRFKQANATAQVDILFLGSSHAYRTFDTRKYNQQGITAYNLGSSSQSHIQTEWVLNKYLNVLSPKIVVYEVYPLIFTLDGVESALDIVYNVPPDRHTFQMALQMNHSKIWGACLASFFEFHVKGTDLEKWHAPAVFEMDTCIEGGFTARQLQHFAFSPESIVSGGHNPVNKKQWAAFERNLKILKSKSCKIILVEAPIPPSVYLQQKQSEAWKYLKQMPLPVLRFNELTEWHDSLHFYDSHHLNSIGVQKFNELLLPYVNMALEEAP